MTSSTLGIFDTQIRDYSPDLKNLGLSLLEINKVATSIYHEVKKEKQQVLQSLHAITPVNEESLLIMSHQGLAMNAYMAPQIQNTPGIAMAHTIAMSYIVFVYYKDTIIKVLSDTMPEQSVSKKCSSYFHKNEQTKGFRNAFAHGNWSIKENKIEYFVERSYKSGNYIKSEISQEKLLFLYTFGRGVSFAAIQALIE